MLFYKLPSSISPLNISTLTYWYIMYSKFIIIPFKNKETLIINI